MSIPGRLYDGAASPANLIASVRLTTERTAAPVEFNYKQADWTDRLGGPLSLRVTAEGVTSLAWIATLYARQDAKAVASYSVVMDDGDGHAGPFVVAELGESADGGEVRRFRLVLLSTGPVTYSPAP